LRELPNVTLGADTTVTETPDGYRLETTLVNESASPALMVRLKAVRAASGDRILPVLYSDNYVFLMPGERRGVITEVRREDARGERPAIVVEGFNVGEVRTAAAAPARSAAARRR